jgi:DNA-binding transcriptional regulator YiaG
MKGKNSAWNSGHIKALRRYMGLTQANMANELGTRQQTISEWEIGLYEPRGTSVKLLDIIAERSGFKYTTDQEK